MFNCVYVCTWMQDASAHTGQERGQTPWTWSYKLRHLSILQRSADCSGQYRVWCGGKQPDSLGDFLPPVRCRNKKKMNPSELKLQTNMGIMHASWIALPVDWKLTSQFYSKVTRKIQARNLSNQFVFTCHDNQQQTRQHPDKPEEDYGGNEKKKSNFSTLVYTVLPIFNENRLKKTHKEN